jgi:carboxypeptidase Q
MRLLIPFLFFLSFGAPCALHAQVSDEDAFVVRGLYDDVLTRSSSYEWLRHLCKHIGHRASGTGAYLSAVEYTRQMLDSIGCDSVWLQPVTVPHWERGSIEKARIVHSALLGQQELSVAALGGSGATPSLGVTGEVIEVHSLDELENLPAKEVKGKIVFFNRPMDPKQISAFSAYGGAVDQRGSGPNLAAKMGAIACLTRSMTLKYDDVPHSGGTRFDDDVTPIPAAALGIQSAELLSTLLQKEGTVSVNLQLDCRRMPDVLAYNVIGEIRGREFPNEIIAVGGHLDSWDIGEGAHDDGTGCVQAMEILHAHRRMGMRPKRTLRCVLFANEEFGLRGATRYAEAAAADPTRRHIAAIESDGGGHTPRGFSVDANEQLLSRNFKRVLEWRNLLAPYGAADLDRGYSGADVGPLRPQGVLLFGFRPDSQRYFDYHHARTDVFEAVHKRELELGAAAMLSLVWLLDTYGVQ